MGMFDYVSFNGDDDWQTKDFDCELVQYQITDAGKLQIEQFSYEDLPEKDWPTQPGDEWHGLVGTTRKLHGGWKDYEFTGTVNIYKYDDKKQWVEWEMQFDHGQLTHRRLLSRRAHPHNPVEDPTRGAGNTGEEA